MLVNKYQIVALPVASDGRCVRRSLALILLVMAIGSTPASGAAKCSGQLRFGRVSRWIEQSSRRPPTALGKTFSFVQESLNLFPNSRASGSAVSGYSRVRVYRKLGDAAALMTSKAEYRISYWATDGRESIAMTVAPKHPGELLLEHGDTFYNKRDVSQRARSLSE